jgi:hypothetical protein
MLGKDFMTYRLWITKLSHCDFSTIHLSMLCPISPTSPRHIPDFFPTYPRLLREVGDISRILFITLIFM